jgi:hypothetical protein
MKNADMKKLCSEEKTGSPRELFSKNEFSCGYFISLIFIFLIFSPHLFSQIPIKGFCKYDYYEVEQGFTNFTTMNYNGDFFTDMVLFNPGSKRIASVEGKPNGKLEMKRTSLIPYDINNIQITDDKTFPYTFAFTSRINRKAGIYEFRSNGRAVLRSSINFDSYPEMVSVADINNDGKNEMLISGGAFNGLSIITQERKLLKEKKIAQGSVFSHSSFIDLNNDGFNDIAAYDIVAGSFIFFYNNSAGEFKKVRSVPVFEQVAYLKTFDINLDSYEDIVFADGKSINIFYGDFKSSYDTRNKIYTHYRPDKFVIGDFNRDGLIDLVYLNYENSVVSVIYAENESGFYPEIIYLQTDGLKDIVPYYSKFINGIAALSSKGKIHTITTITSIAEEVNIAIGGKPSAISFFNNEKSETNDICFIDEYDKQIKFLLRNSAGIPNLFYSYSLYEKHSKIINGNMKPGAKTYICFSPGEKLIEIVSADFNNNILERNALYSPGRIKDLKIKYKNESDYDLYIIYSEGSKLNLGIFEYSDSRFTFSEKQIEPVNALEASVGILNDVSVFYWQSQKINKSIGEDKPLIAADEISLKYISSTSFSEIPISLISVPVSNDYSITSFTGDILNIKKDIHISFITGSHYNFAVVATDTFSGKGNYIIRDDEKDGTFRITSENQLFFGETRFNGLKRLCVYLPGQNSVNKLEFADRGKKIVHTLLIDASNVGSYFIKNMTKGNYHLVYSDIDKNCIIIKRI